MTQAAFWVYEIDWRTRAVNIVQQVTTPAEADQVIEGRIRGMSEEQRQDFSAHKSLAFTPVSDEMVASSKQWRRVLGKELQDVDSIAGG